MNLFRSEEHIERWLAGRPPGATLPVTKLGELAHAWWHDRVVVYAGGIPLIVDGLLVGGLGGSGGAADEDEACVVAAAQALGF